MGFRVRHAGMEVWMVVYSISLFIVIMLEASEILQQSAQLLSNLGPDGTIWVMA